jgi:hypothetical protein
MNDVDSGRFRKFTVLIAGVHFVVATFLAAVLNIWIDEAYTLDTTGRTLAYAWHRALHFEAQAPGYFLLLNLWHRIIDTVFFARFLSILCTTFTILAAHRLSRQFFGNQVPPSLLPLFVAAQPLTLYAAVEMRRYALILPLISVLLITFERAFRNSSGSTVVWRAMYSLAALAAVYVDYFSAFVLIAQSFLLLVNRRWRDLGLQAVILLLVAALCLPLLAEIPSQVGVYDDLESSSKGQLSKTARFVSNALDNLLMTQWLHPWNRAAKLLLMMAVGYVLYRTLRRMTAEPSAATPIDPILLTAVIGACFVAVSFVATPSIIQPKHFMVLLVPLALVAAGTWTLFRRPVAISVVAGLVALNLGASVHDFKHLAKRGDYIRVANFVERHEQPNEPIVVFYAEVALGFQHHYGGMNRLVVLPRPVDYREYDLRQHVLPENDDFWADLQSNLKGSERIWVLTDPFSDPGIGGCGYGDVDFNCGLFEDFLEREYVQLQDKRFYQSRVRYFHRSST